MDTLRIDICYRRLRVGWVIQSGDTPSLQVSDEVKKQAKRISRFWLTMSVVLLCLAMSPAPAQEAQVRMSGLAIPDALKAIPAVGGVCRRDDAASASADLQAYRAALDLSCAIPAQEAALLLEKSGSSLIDLRSSTDYLAWHAPDSMNLTLTEILTKPYLRDKRIVLMGSGKLEAESFHACMRLKQEGFRQVFVVRGGILGWMQQGYATQGNPPLVSDAFRMTSGELWAASQFVENRIFLDVDRASMRTLLPSATLLSTNAIDALRSAANRKADRKKTIPMLGLIFITSPEITENRIRELQQAMLPNPLLIYSGSESEYRTFVDQQKAVLSARARGPKKLGCGL